MKAINYSQFGGPISLVQVEDPVPPADGVVIRVCATGLCRSDWHGWMGHDTDIRLPHTPGHEFAGEVVATGDSVTKYRVGDRVTVPFSIGCGACRPCQAGQLQVCDNYFQPGFTAAGSFAEFVAIPHADLNLVRLPESVEFATAALLGCRYATAYHALKNQATICPGDWLAVHGCGGVGLAAIQIGRALNAKVVAIDTQPEALALATREGADETVLVRPRSETPEAMGRRVCEVTDGGAQTSIDAIGGWETCLQSIASLRKQGSHIQVGLVTGTKKHALPMERVLAEELRIVGSHGCAAHDYSALLELIAEGAVKPDRLVTDRVPLREAIHRLPAMDEQGVVVFEP